MSDADARTALRLIFGTGQVPGHRAPRLKTLLDGLASVCWLLAADQHSRRTSLASAFERAGLHGRPENLISRTLVNPPTTITPATTLARVLPVTPVTPVTRSVSRLEISVKGSDAKEVTIGASGNARELHQLVEVVLQGLKNGQLERPTVTRIREYLQCSQKTAAAVRRSVATRHHQAGGSRMGA